MFKVVVAVKRNLAISVEDFQSYWLDRHGPLVARVPGLRRYVQSHPLTQGYAKGELAFDVIDELWFETADSFAAARSKPEWLAADRDGENFVDRARTVVVPVDVYVIKDGPVPEKAVKSMEFLNRRPDMELGEFRDYWRNHHGPLSSRVPVMPRYEQNHLSQSAYETGPAPSFDGIAIMWFASTADMKLGAATQEYAAVRADAPNFVVPGPPSMVITREHVVLA